MMFDCPRCGAKDVQAAYYGPCPTCREALNAAFYKEPTVRDKEAYVPKMNVTPNAVALKEDN